MFSETTIKAASTDVLFLIIDKQAVNRLCTYK